MLTTTLSSHFSSLVVAAGIMSAATLSVFAEDAMISPKEFKASCAVCHGLSGTGDGELAKWLIVKPADLTMLAKKNGGEFPFLRVFQTIDGRALVNAHGDREMPIWGDRYAVEAGVAPGTFGSELLVRARILELVYYLQTIQKK